MNRHRANRIAVSLCLAAFLASNPARSLAQTRPQNSPPTSQQRGVQPAGAAQAQQPLAEAQPDPNLVRVLEEWFQSSKSIEKLEGTHKRFTYDYVFQVEKQAVGEFYYKAPDGGRIDLIPAKPKVTEQSKKHPVTGEEVSFAVQADLTERWICDGQRILVIDDVQKTVQQFNIPEEAQGANIMDGPLPFLFGMQPQKALDRYRMKLLVTNANMYELFVEPKQGPDKANYQWARVQIERATMLPIAVQMMDPTGKRETVYTFPEIKKNPRSPLIPWVAQDPFNPKLKDYVIQAPLPVVKEAGPDGNVPSIVGFDYRTAELKLKQAGYGVKLIKGPPAINKELVHHVASQDPKGRSPLPPGSVVRVTLFAEQVEQTSAKVPSVPNLAGMYFKDAEANLKEAGYIAKFQKGRVALQAKDQYRVYEQTPPAGAILEKGGEVHLTLYIKPE